MKTFWTQISDLKAPRVTSKGHYWSEMEFLKMYTYDNTKNLHTESAHFSYMKAAIVLGLV